MKIAFVYRRADLPSSRVRGDQIAAALGCAALPYSFETAQNFHLLVYVKFPAPADEMQSLRAKGIRQVIDVLDNYNLRMLLKRQHFIDGLIAANFTHKVFLERHFDTPVQVIAHHHANFENIRPPARGGKNPVLGYVGHRRHWSANHFVTRLGFEIYTDFEFPANLAESYGHIDIGFAFRKDAQKVRFNSSLKLLNFMSFGIPSVVCPEIAYLEVANHGRECLFAHDKEAFTEMLRFLAAHERFRQQMGQRAFKRAADFHISKIAEHYRTFFARFFPHAS